MSTTIDAVTAAEAMGYEWATDDAEAVEDLTAWVESVSGTTGPAADESYLPVDADELLRPLLVADPAQTFEELRRAAVAGYTRRLVEIWREA